MKSLGNHSVSEFHRAKARYASQCDDARRRTAENLIPHIRVDFTLTGWGAKAKDAYEKQWLAQGRHPDGAWDWVEIFRRHNEIDRLDVAIWGPDKERLCGLALGLTTGPSVLVRFLAGDSRDGCPLKGRRSLIVLECAALYGQARGKSELRVQPVNDTLVELYRDVFGFSLVTPRKEEPYFKKGI